jgi:electron transfer flavoprotein alpha subunit
VLLHRQLYAGSTAITPHRISLSRRSSTELHLVTPTPEFVATLQPGVRGVAVDPRLPAPTVREAAPSGRAMQPSNDATVTAVLPPDPATIDLAEAERIIGGGAGLDQPSRVEQLVRIGAAIGASMGATRVITDRGWVPHERQIGTTGVVVDPQLYLAFGVSGAVQHTSGLGNPDHIISVNTDGHCPMMQLADLAIVADANATLDHLEQLLAEPAEGADA